MLVFAQQDALFPLISLRKYNGFQVVLSFATLIECYVVHAAFEVINLYKAISTKKNQTACVIHVSFL